MVRSLRLLFLLLLLPFVLAGSAVAQVAVSSEEAAQAAPYNIRSIILRSKELKGKLIKLQFVTRATGVESAADGGLSGQVVDSPDTRLTQKVQVPEAAVAWFMNLPTTYTGGPGYTVYARLSTDKFGSQVATLLGRKLRPVGSGSMLDW